MIEHQLIIIANFKMPYGKYKDEYIVNIPESYIIWMLNNATLNNNIKEKLRFIKEIKDNGLEHLLRPLIKKG